MNEPQDWAPYPQIDEAIRAYLRDQDAALEALAGAVDLRSVQGFTMERLVSPLEWGEALWQEVALTDGTRLILWHGEDELDPESGTRIFTSSVRTIPLSAVVDQGLRHRFTVDQYGRRSMHSVMLYLATQTLERSLTELSDATETRTMQFVETYRFSKSVTDGGLAQMQRLLQFGRIMSRLAARQRI